MNCFLIQQVDNDFISFKVFHLKNYLLFSAYKQKHKLGSYPKRGTQGSLSVQALLCFKQQEIGDSIFKVKCI